MSKRTCVFRLLLLLNIVLRLRIATGFQVAEIVLESGDTCYYDADSRAGTCLVFPYETLRWHEAEADCENVRGGVFIAYGDEDTLQIVREGMRREDWTSAWIGIKRQSADDWKWLSDQQSVGSFNVWRDGQAPNTALPPSKDCVLVVPYESYQWSGKQCGFAAGYICETVTDSAICEDAKYRYDEVFITGQRCFFVKDQSELSWYLSRVECERAGAVLATIDNQTIHDRLVDVSPGTDTQSEGYWIGLSRVDWVSAAGEVVTKFFWESGQPSRTDSDCVRMERYGNDFMWANWNCVVDLNYICEIAMGSTDAVSVSTEDTPLNDQTTASHTTDANMHSSTIHGMDDTESTNHLVSTDRVTTGEPITSGPGHHVSTVESTTSDEVEESSASDATTGGFPTTGVTSGEQSTDVATTDIDPTTAVTSSEQNTDDSVTSGLPVTSDPSLLTSKHVSTTEVTSGEFFDKTTTGDSLDASTQNEVTGNPTTEPTSTTNITTAMPCVNLDVVFILDSSISQTNWNEVLRYTSSIIKSYSFGTDCFLQSVINLGENVTIQFYLDTYSDRESVLEAIQSVEPVDGIANVSEAIRLMHRNIFVADNGDRAEVPNVAILIVDTSSGIVTEGAIQEARDAKRKGIYTIVIDIGNVTLESDLKRVSSKPREKFYLRVSQFGFLSDTRKRILNLLKGISNDRYPLDTTENVQQTSIPSKLSTDPDTFSTFGKSSMLQDTTASITTDGIISMTVTPDNSTLIGNDDVAISIVVLAVGLVVVSLLIGLLAMLGVFCLRKKRQRRSRSNDRAFLSNRGSRARASQGSATSRTTATSGGSITTPWGSMRSGRIRRAKRLGRAAVGPPFGLAKAEDLPNTMFYNSWRIPADHG